VFSSFFKCALKSLDNQIDFDCAVRISAKARLKALVHPPSSILTASSTSPGSQAKEILKHGSGHIVQITTSQVALGEE
jgi:hypothetical protein